MKCLMNIKGTALWWLGHQPSDFKFEVQDTSINIMILLTSCIK